MIKRKNRAFTLIELLITLSILVIVLGILYPFFSSNYTTFINTETSSDLQREGDKAIDIISKAAMQAKGIEEIKTLNDLSILENFNENQIKFLKLKSDNNPKKFLMEDNILYYFKDDNSQVEAAQYIEKIEISPATDGEKFKETKGIKININLKKGKMEKQFNTTVYFRN